MKTYLTDDKAEPIYDSFQKLSEECAELAGIFQNPDTEVTEEEFRRWCLRAGNVTGGIMNATANGVRYMLDRETKTGSPEPALDALDPA